MKNLNNLWHRLTDSHATDNDKARQEYMTKVILVILNIISFGLLVGFGVGVAIGVMITNIIAPVFIIVPFLFGSWWLADKGYWRIVSYILPFAFLLLALRTNYTS